MMRLSKIYNLDPPANNAGQPAALPDDWTEIAGIDQVDDKTPAVVIDPADGAINKDDKVPPVDDKIPAGEKVDDKQDEKTDDKKPDEKAADDKDNKIPPLDPNAVEEPPVLDVTDLDLTGEKKAVGDADGNTTWNDIGEVVGLKVEADTPEAFAKAHTEAVEAAERRGAKAAINEKYGEGAEHFLELYSKGVNPYELQKEVQVFDEYLSLTTPEDRAAFLLENDGLTEIAIQEEIERMKKENVLNSTIEKATLKIQAKRDKVENDFIEQHAATQVKAKEAVQEQLLAENKAVADALRKVKVYMGHSVPQNAINALADRIEKGDFRALWKSDPAKAAKMVLDFTFSERVVKAVKSDVSKEKKSEVHNKLHKLEDAKKSMSPGGKSNVPKEGDDDDVFSVFAMFSKEDVKSVMVNR